LGPTLAPILQRAYAWSKNLDYKVECAFEQFSKFKDEQFNGQDAVAVQSDY